MAFTVKTHSLSSISPINFVYEYNDNKETLSNTYIPINNDFGYIKHDALINFKDSALSKKNCLILTTSQSMSGIFQRPANRITKRNFTNTTNTVVLKSENKALVEANGFLYRGGPGGCGMSENGLLVTIVPVGNGYAELRVGKTGYIIIDQEYPFTARLTNDPMDASEFYTRRFKIEQGKNKISLGILTKEGFRYLAFGNDGVLRAIGLVMNNTVVNSYYFDVESETATTDEESTYDYTAENPEVKYFNQLLNTTNRSNLNINIHKDVKANMLLTCPTYEMSKKPEVNVNIALLRTNYSAEGIFLHNI